MPTNPEIVPADLIQLVKYLLKQRRGEWMAPQELWDQMCRIDPALAERVTNRVNGYKDPARNNEVWFLSNTLYHVGKLNGFSVSDIRAVPSMKDKSIWLIARAEA